jgi:hypothetical protein
MEFYWGSANLILGLAFMWLAARGSPSSVRFGLAGMAFPLVLMYGIKNMMNENLFAPFMYSSSVLVDCVLGIIAVVGFLFSKTDRQMEAMQPAAAANIPGAVGRVQVRPVAVGRKSE